MARVFAPDIYRDYHGVGTELWADARVRMQGPLQKYLDAGAKAKTVTMLIYFIDRVSL